MDVINIYSLFQIFVAVSFIADLLLRCNLPSESNITKKIPAWLTKQTNFFSGNFLVLYTRVQIKFVHHLYIDWFDQRRITNNLMKMEVFILFFGILGTCYAATITSFNSEDGFFDDKSRQVINFCLYINCNMLNEWSMLFT